MKILFLHQNFPGQYRSLAPALQRRGHKLLAISMKKERKILNVHNINYQLQTGNASQLHSWLTTTESCLLRGEAVARVAQKLKAQGYYPDVIYGHSGWGETLFVKKVWPNAKLISFFEFYYREKGTDVGFDPEFSAVTEDTAMRLHIRNAHMLLNLTECDVGVSPTDWQKSLFPAEFQYKIRAIHDGINTDKLKPSKTSWIKLAVADITFKADNEVITFINRNLEPLRGYHRFMRALPEIMKRRPKAHIIIVGGDQQGYGGKPEGEISNKQQYFDEIKDQVDSRRIHFIGKIPYNILINLFRLSSVHVYLTYPFVLSWSLMEAMSLGCAIVASRTAPVEEIIRDKKEGILVDFFSSEALSDAVCHILEQPQEYEQMRYNARQKIIKHYDFNKICLPAHLKLIEN